MSELSNRIEDDSAYVKKVNKTREEVEKLVFHNTNWEVYKRSKDITVARIKSPHWRGHAFKTEAIIPMELAELSRRIHPCSPYRTKWDPLLEKTEVVQTINQKTLILRHLIKSQAMGVISARDSVDMYTFLEAEDNSRIAIAESIETNLCPVVPSHVRIWSFPTGIFLHRTADVNKTKVISLFNADMHLNKIPIQLAEAFVPRCSILLNENMKKCATLKEEKDYFLPGIDINNNS